MTATPIERADAGQRSQVPPPARRLGFWNQVKDLAWLPRARFVVFLLARFFAGGVALTPIYTYLWCALSRISFPFDIEWMEGSMVDHVGRVLANKSVYVEPSLEFAPFIYNPVFYYVSAVVASVVGLGYTALRSVSLVASLVSLFLLFEICRRETRSILGGVVAAGLFAATYKLSGAWFDIGRVDSLAVAWCLLTTYCVRYGEKSRTLVLGGVFAALMFGTKQSLGPIIPLFIVYLFLFERWRKALGFAATSVGLSASSVLALNVMTDGWYLRYTLFFPMGHEQGFPLEAWQTETSGSLIFAFALALAFLFGTSSTKSKFFFGGLGITLVWLAWYSRVHSLSYVNVNIPAHVAIALLAGLGFSAFERREPVTAGCAILTVLLQFRLLEYNPREFMPNAADRAAAASFAALLRSFPGEVYVAQHGFIGAREGRGTFVHDIAMVDVERTTAAPAATRRRIRNELRQAIAERRFSAIIMDWPATDNIPGVERHYRRANFDIGPLNALRTRVGLSVRPAVLWVPRETPAGRVR